MWNWEMKFQKKNMDFQYLSINRRNSGGLFCVCLLFNSENTIVKSKLKENGSRNIFWKEKRMLSYQDCFSGSYTKEVEFLMEMTKTS